MIADLFVADYLSDKDTDTHHICGTCGELRPLSDFYKDGKTKDGKVKYRRDCKDCYKQTRIYEARLKERSKSK